VLNRKKIEAEFRGGEINNDDGVLLLRQIDKCIGLLNAVNNVTPDPRDPRYIEHNQWSLLQQRTYGLCLGYEDLNDHGTLREDQFMSSFPSPLKELILDFDATR